jgi:hypothetical protein
MATLISRAPAPRRYRTFEVAIVLSLLLHVLLGGLYRDYWMQIARVMNVQTAPHEREVATSTITIERKKTVPVPLAKPIVKPEPVAKPEPQPVEQPEKIVPKETVTVATAPKPVAAPPHPVEQRRPHVLSVQNVDAPKISYSKPTEGTTNEHSDFEKQTAPNAGRLKHGTATYSQEDLQALNQKFAHTIATTRDTADLAPVQVKVPQSVHRSAVSFEGLQGDLHPGQGYINPIVAPTYRGGYAYYYTHYRFMWPDGHLEEDDIPWVFVYPRNADPFARGDRRIPLQAPPPDYTPNRPLKPVLQAFFPNLYPNAPEARTAE